VANEGRVSVVAAARGGRRGLKQADGEGVTRQAGEAEIEGERFWVLFLCLIFFIWLLSFLLFLANLLLSLLLSH